MFFVQKPTKYLAKHFYITVDTSNGIYTANNVRKTNESIYTNQAIRVNLAKLVEVLEEDKLRIDIKTRVVGSSTNETVEADPLWEAWRDKLYRSIVSPRGCPARKLYTR
ncbi:unnamed protein product [Adineta ricciae]|uniref:Uncharacterized protein n=1 Tax=Adineta ricciae TaxID=249248 RepID=A0A815JDM1_ADIRI|nr:unnamed protein product [Adineta ricciae]